REIIPCLTNAHIYQDSRQVIYKFLSTLQTQQLTTALKWDWAPFDTAPFLPRIRSGRFIIERARWRLNRKQIEQLCKGNANEQFQQAQDLRRQLHLPRFVLLAEGDNELTIDLDNVICLETLINIIKDEKSATLIEMFPAPDQLCVTSPAGKFVH